MGLELCHLECENVSCHCFVLYLEDEQVLGSFESFWTILPLDMNKEFPLVQLSFLPLVLLECLSTLALLLVILEEHGLNDVSLLCFSLYCLPASRNPFR